MDVQPLVVRLLQAVRFPANHGRMVRAAVDRPLSGAVRMFEPSGDLTKTGLSMEQGMVELDGNSVVTLVVQNQSPSPVYLPGEQVLGKLQVATVLPDQVEPNGLVGNGSGEVEMGVGAYEESDNRRVGML